MKLNETAYTHKQIRKACQQLELLTDMKLVTDLSNDFNQIRFVNKLGYILIDYRNEACFILGHKLSHVEWQLVQDVMLYCNWLETGEKYSKRNTNLMKN